MPEGHSAPHAAAGQSAVTVDVAHAARFVAANRPPVTQDQHAVVNPNPASIAEFRAVAPARPVAGRWRAKPRVSTTGLHVLSAVAPSRRLSVPHTGRIMALSRVRLGVASWWRVCWAAMRLRRVPTKSAVILLATVGTMAGATPALADDPGRQALAWGTNTYFQLGDGTATDRSAPVEALLPDGLTVTDVDAGFNHSVALTSDGLVLAWGGNDAGQLGDNTTTDRDRPVPVLTPGGTKATAVAAGYLASLALTSTGQVYAWGAGPLGNGSDGDSTFPVLVSLPPGVTAVAVAANSGHAMVLTSTGQVYAWGENNFGQLGNGTNTNSNVPVLASLPGGVTATSIGASEYHGLVVTSTGQVYTWGWNFYGQLGDGTNVNRNTPGPVPLPGGTTVTDVAGGYGRSFAITATGRVLAWGGGLLGNDSNIDSNTPVSVSLADNVRVTDISAGDSHSLAVVAPRTGVGMRCERIWATR